MICASFQAVMKYYEVHSGNNDGGQAGSSLITPAYDRLMVNEVVTEYEKL